MRLAVELSNDGIPVLWVDKGSQADTSLIRKRVAEFEDRVVLAIDDAELFGLHLARFLRDVVPQRPNLLFAFAVPSTRFDELEVILKRTGETVLAEHAVPSLTDDDVDGLIGVLQRHNRLGILAGADQEARRRAFRDKCGRQMIVAMIEATTGELFDQKIEKEYLDLPGLQQFIYAVVCIASQEKQHLTRDEVLLAAQGLPGGDAYEALTLLVRRHVVSSPPPGNQYRARHHVIAQVVFDALREQRQLLAPLKALVYALASKVEPIVRKVTVRTRRKCCSPNTITWFRQSRLMDPISLSAYGFAFGTRAGVLSTRSCIGCSASSTASEKVASRTRGQASPIEGYSTLTKTSMNPRVCDFW
jgi:hypothetical protein